MNVFITSKMVQNIVLLCTILFIFEKNKGVQCANHISDEFNLICYMSMYIELRRVLYLVHDYPEQTSNYLMMDINVFHSKLLRVNSWRKYLKEPLSIWANYSNINEWSRNINNAEIEKVVLDDVTSTTNFSKFNGFNWMTPRGKKFYEILVMKSNDQIENMALATIEFCKANINNLSAPTEHIESYLNNLIHQNVQSTSPLSSFFGCVVLLANDDVYLKYIHNKSTNEQAMSLVYIIDDALQDIYLGMLYILRRINNYHKSTEAYNTDVELMKMMITVYYNVVKLTDLLFSTKDIRGVNRRINKLNEEKSKSSLIDWVYGYKSFKRDFKQIWNDKLAIKKESQDNTSASLLVSRGRLIQNGRIEPSIIGYYAVYEESWENMEAINYVNNTDDRIVFLMEINAWTTLLYQSLKELKESLTPLGLLVIKLRKPDFAIDMEFLQKYESLFFRNSL